MDRNCVVICNNNEILLSSDRCVYCLQFYGCIVRTVAEFDACLIASFDTADAFITTLAIYDLCQVQCICNTVHVVKTKSF